MIVQPDYLTVRPDPASGLRSKADILGSFRDVRFTPKSGHGSARSRCPLCAKSRHHRAQL